MKASRRETDRAFSCPIIVRSYREELPRAYSNRAATGGDDRASLTHWGADPVTRNTVHRLRVNPRSDRVFLLL
jgi:hypothetical protein